MLPEATRKPFGASPHGSEAGDVRLFHAVDEDYRSTLTDIMAMDVIS
jgi:hypothetical protein